MQWRSIPPPFFDRPSAPIGFALGLAVVIGCLAAAPALGQQHFTDCTSRTEHNATIIFPDSAEISLNDESIAAGDEIAVFTESGVCTGAVVWSGQATALTVWGRDTGAVSNNGLRRGEAMHFRVWDGSAGVEYGPNNSNLVLTLGDSKPFFVRKNQYEPDGIYLIRSLRLNRGENASR